MLNIKEVLRWGYGGNKMKHDIDLFVEIAKKYGIDVVKKEDIKDTEESNFVKIDFYDVFPEFKNK